MKIELFDHDERYRGVQVSEMPIFPSGFCASHGEIERDIETLILAAYQAGRDKSSADIAEMNEQLTRNTLGALSRIAALESVLRKAGIPVTAANNVCPVCNGSGAYMLVVGRNTPVMCQRCAGTGRQKGAAS